MAQTSVRGKQIADGSTGQGVDLLVDVQGVLPIPNGGTGLATIGTTAGQVPTSDGAGALVMQTPATGTQRTFSYFMG